MVKAILRLFSLVDDTLSKPFDFNLENKTVTIGRSRENDIQIPNGFLASHVSRKHGKIILENGKVIYIDSSSQGTVYSGRFGMRLLRDGEKMELLDNDFILLPMILTNT